MKAPATLVPALALCAAALLAGCGGDDEEGTGSATDDEAAVLEAVETFYAAALDGDGETACGLLTDDAVAEVEEGATGLAEDQVCVELVETLGDLLGEEAKELAEQNEPEVIQVEGDAATVATTSFNQESAGGEVATEEIELDLVKDDGEWKIAGFPE
ncbi:MAG: nuclear transport factor 2 family protein [Solirubrobacterales bacterium]